MYLKKGYIIVALIFAFTSSAMLAQFVVQGKVVSAASNEPVPNAEVYLTSLRKSTVTNDFGDFKRQLFRAPSIIFEPRPNSGSVLKRVVYEGGRAKIT